MKYKYTVSLVGQGGNLLQASSSHSAPIAGGAVVTFQSWVRHAENQGSPGLEVRVTKGKQRINPGGLVSAYKREQMR